MIDEVYLSFAVLQLYSLAKYFFLQLGSGSGIRNFFPDLDADLQMKKYRILADADPDPKHCLKPRPIQLQFGNFQPDFVQVYCVGLDCLLWPVLGSSVECQDKSVAILNGEQLVGSGTYGVFRVSSNINHRLPCGNSTTCR